MASKYYDLKFVRGDQERKVRFFAPDSGITTNSIALRRFGSPRVSRSGYEWRQIKDQWYYHRNNTDGVDYMPRSQMLNSIDPETESHATEFYTQLGIIEQMLTPGGDGYNPDAQNMHKMTTDDLSQYYDSSVPIADRTTVSSQEFTIRSTDDNTSICKLNFSTKPMEGPSGPYTGIFNTGLYAFKPFSDDSGIVTAGAYTGTPSGPSGVFTTTDPPLIALWTIKVEMTQQTDYRYGETVECILIGIRIPQCVSGPGWEVQFAIVSANALEGAEVPPNPNPGDQGANVTPYGWTGTHDFSSPDDTPHAPTGYSFVNRWAHGVSLYYVNDLQMSAFMSALWDFELLGKLKDLFSQNNDFIRGVIALHKLPVAVTTSGNRKLTILGKSFDGYIALDSLPQVASSIVQYTTDEMPIEGIYTSFLDLDRAQLIIKLPFVGNVPIDVKSARLGAVYVNYFIDVLTGNLVAQIYAKSPAPDAAWVRVYQGSGNCALPIPFSGNTQGGLKQLGAALGIAGGAVASLASGNPLPALLGSAASLTTAMQGQNTATYNYMASEASPLGDLLISATVSGDMAAIPDNQQQTQGFAASCGGLIGDYVGTGLLAGIIHAEIEGASDEELAEIESAVQGGIML